VQTLCIRLFSELLLQRYRVPLPDASESLLSRNAVSLFEENKAFLQQLPEGHRSQPFNTLVLPQAEHAIEAMGHSMAYSAGLRAHTPSKSNNLQHLHLDIFGVRLVRDSRNYDLVLGSDALVLAI
jgi:hypothetical protein